MRVIAGRKKGLKLETPAGIETTRPTADRVKEAVFGSIQQQISGSTVLDLFAGSGALGIEAISRGARKGVFVEKNKEPLACLKKNLERAGFLDEAVVYALDYQVALGRINERKFDFIFLDPPYRGGYYENALKQLLGKEMMGENTTVVVEYLAHMEIPIPQELEIKKQKQYGKTGILFLKRR